MDNIDRKLLNLVQHDASRTNIQLAENVGLSPSSCLRRMQRLHKTGIIDRIVAILNPRKSGRDIKAIITVNLKLHGEKHMQAFINRMTKEIAVTGVYAVTGETDVVLMLRLQDMGEFDELCQKFAKEESNIARYVTMMVIRTAKEETAIEL